MSEDTLTLIDYRKFLENYREHVDALLKAASKPVPGEDYEPAHAVARDVAQLWAEVHAIFEHVKDSEERGQVSLIPGAVAVSLFDDFLKALVFAQLNIAMLESNFREPVDIGDVEIPEPPKVTTVSVGPDDMDVDAKQLEAYGNMKIKGDN